MSLDSQTFGLRPRGTPGPLQPAVETIASHPELLTAEDITTLRSVLPPSPSPSPPAGDEDFDLKAEVTEQIRLLRGLRSRVFNPDGALANGVSIRDCKGYLEQTQALLGFLMKFRDTINRDERLRKIELATIAAIKTAPPDIQKLFFEELESLLEEI